MVFEGLGGMLSDTQLVALYAPSGQAIRLPSPEELGNQRQERIAELRMRYRKDSIRGLEYVDLGKLKEFRRDNSREEQYWLGERGKYEKTYQKNVVKVALKECQQKAKAINCVIDLEESYLGRVVPPPYEIAHIVRRIIFLCERD